MLRARGLASRACPGWLQAYSVASPIGHYERLGVRQDASMADVKKAFREKALALHPDMARRGELPPDRTAFLQLLTSYRVLSDARERARYDAAMRVTVRAWPTRHDRFAGDGTPRRAPKAPGPDLEWLYDFVAGRGSRPQHGHTTALDRVRADFLEELRDALDVAVLGPALDPAHMCGLTLPEEFEGEERSRPESSPDLLHIVHGRHLLGRIIHDSNPLLSQQASVDRVEGGTMGLLSEPPQASLDLPSGASNGGIETVGRSAVSASGPADESLAKPHPVPGTTLVRLRYVGANGAEVASGTRTTGSDGRWVLEVRGREGQTLGRMESAPGWGPAAISVLDGARRHCLTVVKTATPLVRHISLAVEPGAAPGSSPARPLIVARAQRAWLPSSRLWLFRPRLDTHACGGWSFRLSPHAARHGVHAHLLILLAAFESLDAELAERQPSWGQAAKQRLLALMK
ncbi:hypothetical protein ACKKBF_B31940 [Auxenochlorella protothecoides x Auxenochlorella symbiontica]